MSDDNIITGKVAEIISDREVILNRGSSDGIHEGMLFNILDLKGYDIKDPDTDEPLGGFKTIKVTVVAVQVAERITLAETFRTQTVNVGGNGPDIAKLVALSAFNPPKYIEKVETLRIDPNTPRPISERDSLVSKGDLFESDSGYKNNSSRTVSVRELPEAEGSDTAKQLDE